MSVPRRPFSLTITALGIFLLAMWNLWRVWILLQQLVLLQELGATLDPRVRLVMSGIWAGAFVLLAVGLWRRRLIVRRLLPLTLSLYAGYQLAVLLIFAPAPAARQGWVAQLLFFTGAIVWAAWVCLRAAHRDYWLETGGQPPESYPLSPFTLLETRGLVKRRPVVDRGHNGESKD